MGEKDVSSGIVELDGIIEGLRPGDNVVFQVEKLPDYVFFATPFIRSALEEGRNCVYIHFAPYHPIIDDYPGLEVIEVDPGRGFDHFSRTVHNIVEEQGKGAVYLVDNLSALAVAFVVPVAGLVMMLLTWPIEAAVAWRAPTDYRRWL